ncbi:MAG: ribonuclease Y [Candidatus Yanofskybacteria bacterium CG10_big_fil_rev_8_21_14_0_10_46_23]|uniref:Ribonuclease Y n=1 Tax=Candidatus Yanofskybacteria bacterium CG10_big_fil_rev_8_21_14_0_10_46_23 TaxID=1975098 RepID=A0A2H0R6M3_9BACT|nr:MAG: ribonuclease Y [Candidatus Yanofskybacteria bacterium CG10_big_fil_rev_8_21_14_0_10_46_23]
MFFGSIHPLFVAIFGVAIGVALGYIIRRFLADHRIKSAETKAQTILGESKSKAQDILLEAKNKALRILDDAKKEGKERQTQLIRIERLLTKKEVELEEKGKIITRDQKSIEEKEGAVTKTREELEDLRVQHTQKLEALSKISREDARVQLFQKIEDENREEIQERIKKLERDKRDELEQRAKDILTVIIQRYAGSHVTDVSTTVVSLPSDEIKGKIIGKEGRNIKTIERLTGVDVIIDDTPETLILSGFDPVRRQIARLALEKLISDGRIHPAKIEEMVSKATDEIDKKIKEAGEASLYELGIGPVDEKLVYLLGRLAFRTSFGQNVLLHSIEVGHISGMLAQELGADPVIAKKAGLFHDIGKAVDHEVQGSHVQIGRKILEKFGVDQEVIRAMEAHHEEYPYTSLESRIVQTADAISGARPGARRDTVEIYLRRLEDLERIANSFGGVEKTYAVQAGRELRVFVSPSEMDDLTAMKLAKDIAKKIEEEVRYPGEIKVNVIRETRAIEYAR